MKKLSLALLLLFATTAQAAEFKVTVKGFVDGQPIPAQNAFCVATETEKSVPTGDNISPEISWENAPAGTKSFAVIVVDPDVPTKFDDAGVNGKFLPADMPRQNFYHWKLLNIPANVTSIAEGQGKVAPSGSLQFSSDYMKFQNLPETPENIVKYAGYDGPCPPWNDERVHHYHFRVFALNDNITVPTTTQGDDIMGSLKLHAIAEAEYVGTYTLNPGLKK